MRTAAILLSASVAIIGSELLCRWIDGNALLTLHLTPGRATQVLAPPPEPHAIARRYATAIPRAASVQLSWFDEDPEPLPAATMPEWAQRRARHDASDIALYEFNKAFLRDRLCRQLDAAQFGTLDNFLYFDPAGPDIYPSYRLPPHVTFAGGLRTNGLGWRGPEIAQPKPRQTVRLAFVGSSTTINDEGFPFSYPELVGHWLNRWSAAHGWDVRFEIVNTARPGINSHSIAAIVRDELPRVEPDLVVYYEGANQFWPPDYLAYRFGRLYPRPMVIGADGHRNGEISALIARARRLGEAWRGGDGREPVKPLQAIRLDGIDEDHPQPDDPRLPVRLPEVVQDLDAMRRALAPARAELVVSSFVWMVSDGLRLELPRQVGLYTFLNGYWPTSYKNIRRLADLQNHVFAAYAHSRAIPFLDVAGQYPMDPDLFADAIHMRYPGVRLQAWIAFQGLARLIESRVMSGALPRRSMPPAAQSVDVDASEPRTITRSAVLSSCRASTDSTVRLEPYFTND